MATKNNVTAIQFYSAADVMAMLEVGQTTAYKIINNLRKELVEKGYAEYPSGKIPRKYFHERFYCSEVEDTEARKEVRIISCTA